MPTSDVDASLPIEGRATTVRVAYIHPLQAGKVLGLVYAFLVLTLVPLFVFGAIASKRPDATATHVSALVVLGIVVFFLKGFVSGIVVAVLYNLVARQNGGIRVDLR